MKRRSQAMPTPSADAPDARAELAPDARAELRRAGAELAAVGIDSPTVEAEMLLAHVLKVSRPQLLTHGALTDGQLRRLAELMSRRAEGIPLQHLTGTAPFRHIELAVGPGVFIPRPETELIVDLAREQLADARLVVDLCAGSGAIALAVANEYGSAHVIAVEGSQQAAVWLRRNVAARVAAGDSPIEVIISDIRSPELLIVEAGTVDVLLCNPPYVPERIRAGLAPEIAHDPDQAVFAGADGLTLMPAVIAVAARVLRPGGLLAIEHDDSHGHAVPASLKASAQWKTVADHDDLTGRPRFSTAVRL